MAPEARSQGDWLRHMVRVLRVVDHQVRTLRKRQVIEGMKRGDRDGVHGHPQQHRRLRVARCCCRCSS